MLKRLLCLIMISSLLYGDIAYPLSSSSSLQDRSFLEIVSILNNPGGKRDRSGVWLEGRHCKIRVYEPGKARSPRLGDDDVLVYEERIGDRLAVQVYFKGLDEDDKADIRAFRQLLLHKNRDIERGYHMDLEDEVREGLLNYADVDSIYRLRNDLITDGRFSGMYKLYQKRAGEKRYWEYFLDKIPANIRIIKDKDLFEFEHGDEKDLPDFIGLNIKLFEENYSPETQVFLLRHCTDRIRYDRHKTIINDVKYLTKMPKDERRRILEELEGLEYGRFLGISLKEAKEKIREYVGLKFRTHTSPDGAKIWYSVGGNPDAKRTLVFLHGIGINSRDWRHQITFFEKDYRIIAVDLRGFGKSQGLGKRPPHIRNYAEDVEGILTQEGVGDVILIGHSLGGIAALNMDELYRDTPLVERRVKGLVLIASTAGDPSESFIFSGVKGITFRQFLTFFLFYLSQFEFIWNNPLFKRFVKSPLIRPFVRMIFERFIIQRETHPLFAEKLVGSVFMNDLQDLIYGFRAILTHDVSDRLKDIGIPVLWIIGKGDLMIRTRFQEEYAERIRDCRVVRLPRASHYPHARYPRRVNKKIYDFINSGTYRFSQLVSSRIKERYSADVSLDELNTELNSMRIRFIPKIGDENLALIDEVSGIVRDCGQTTGVPDEIMVKAVMLVVCQIIARPSTSIPSAKPITHDELERLYRYVVKSV